MKRLIFFALLMIALCLALASCREDIINKKMTDEYLSEVGISGMTEILFPGEEYVSVGNRARKYTQHSAGQFEDLMNETVTLVTLLGYPVYCTDSAYDEKGGIFSADVKYLFSADSNDDYFVFEDTRFELFYEYEGEVYRISGLFESKDITIEIISVSEVSDTKYLVYSE